MLSVKEAVEKIRAQVTELFGNDVTDMRLEEIEPQTDAHYHLTISFLIPNKNMSKNLTSILGGIETPYNREYKTVEVDKETGEIIRVKILKSA